VNWFVLIAIEFVLGRGLMHPDWLDIEVSTLSFMLSNGCWMANEVAEIERQLEERKAQLLSGLGSATQIFWTAKVQRELDANCRVRRDPVHGWMLDRWIEDPGCWQPVGYIGTGGKLEKVAENEKFHDEGPGFMSSNEDGTVSLCRVVDDKIRPDLIDFLRAHDMQRPGYFVEKAAKAAAIRLENEKAATNKVLMAVDSMTDKRLKEFLEVEKAIQTGDTVTMHGETMRQFEKMTEAGKKAPPGPESSNPGAHPLKLKRDYSKGEGENYGNGNDNGK
jgi:hypothetical protein